MGCSKSIEVSKTIAAQRRVSTLKIKQLDWDDKDDNNETTIASIENIDYFYEIIKHIGSGTYGSVYHAKQKREPFKEVAIKVINLHNIQKLPLQYIKREVQISKKLDHPNIIKFLETYIDKKNVYIVMEYCSGGSLLEWTFKEGDVLDIMKKLFYAVNYMHSQNIIHRDLKLENILFESTSENSDIKIIDFGLAKRVTQENNGKKHTIVGSVAYMAPEVMYNKGYDKSCDIWSLGIIMYRLLSGELPFKSQAQIHTGQLNFENEVWKKVSKQGRDLLRRMIIVNPKLRISIQDALQHKWFSLRTTTLKLTQVLNSRPGNLKVLERFTQYNYYKQFKKEVLSIYIKNFLSKNAELNFRSLFTSLDRNRRGSLTQTDLKSGMERVGMNNQQSEEFANQISKQLNNESNNIQILTQDIIKYSDFLGACIGQDLIQNKDQLRDVFNYIDADTKGCINQQDIKTALQREGRLLSDEKFQDMIDEIDFYFDKNNKLNFENFCMCVGYIDISTLSKFVDTQKSESDSQSQKSQSDSDSDSDSDSKSNGSEKNNSVTGSKINLDKKKSKEKKKEKEKKKKNSTQQKIEENKDQLGEKKIIGTQSQN